MKKGMNKLFAAALFAAMLIGTVGCGKIDVENTEMTTVTEAETVTEATQDETTEAEKTEEDTTEAEDAENDKAPDKGRPDADAGTGTIKDLQEGDIAPDFTAELKGGATFHLSDYDDKIVLLNFWATWCGPCVNEMPAFERLKNDNYDDLEIICINCMEQPETVDNFIDEMDYKFNIGYDVDGKIETYYPTEGIPYTLVIDKGIISAVYVGAYDADTQYQEYKSAIDACR